MFDDCIPVQDKKSLQQSEPLYHLSLPGQLRLPPNIYNNFSFEDIEKSFISKDDENFHNIWRFDNLVPDRSKRFFNEFPRVGSNWDSEHHTYNSDYSFILKWFPAFSQNLFIANWLFPDLAQQYFPQSQTSSSPQQASSGPAVIGKTPSKENTPKANIEENLHHNEHNKKVIFNANPVPTKFERNLCSNLKGNGLYNRKGCWSCYIVSNNTIDLEHDEFGPKFFVRYEDWNKWKKLMKTKVVEAVEEDNMERAALIRRISYSG